MADRTIVLSQNGRHAVRGLSVNNPSEFSAYQDDDDDLTYIVDLSAYLDGATITVVTRVPQGVFISNSSNTTTRLTQRLRGFGYVDFKVQTSAGDVEEFRINILRRVGSKVVLGASGGGGTAVIDGNYGDVVVSGNGTVWTVTGGGGGATDAQTFDTVSAVNSATIDASVNHIRTAGYYANGDGGGALYKRVASGATGAGTPRITSNGGLVIWELSAEGVVNVQQFGAYNDGTNAATTTSAFQAAAAFSKTVYVPRGTFNVNGTVVISLNGSFWFGAGQDNSTITSSSTSAPMFTINTGLQGVQMRDLFLTRGTGVVAGAGADGISCSGVTVGKATFENLRIANQNNGMNLGCTDWSKISNVTCENCYNAGFVIQNYAQDGTCQWYFQNCLAQFNNAQGYLFQSTATTGTATSGAATTLTDTSKSFATNALANAQIRIVAGTGNGQSRTISSNTATVITVSSAWTTNPDATSQYVVGPSQMLVGTLENCATYANTAIGCAYVGSTNIPVQGARIDGGFFGDSGNSEVYLDTFGDQHMIANAFIELSGRGPTGRILTTSPLAQASASGLATAATSTTLSDSTKSFTVNAFTNFGIRMTAGTGSGQERVISSNTATQITVSVAWTTTPDTTSRYEVFSSLGNGVECTANNSGVLLSNLHINGCSRNGVRTSATATTIVNTRVTNCGLSSTAGERNGIYNVAGRSNIVGGRCSNTGAGTSQLFGVRAADGTNISLIGADLTNNATAATTFDANANSATVVGCLPNTTNTQLPIIETNAGSATAPTLTTKGDTNTGIFYPAADVIGFTTGGINRMRVLSNGFVAVGAVNSAPSSTGITNDFLAINTNGMGIGSIGDLTNVLGFATSNTERMRIDASGNVGINATSNLSTLRVGGSFAAQAPQTTTAATYTVAATDYSVRFNGGAACTVTMPSAASFPGRILIFNAITAFAVTSAASNIVPLNSTTAGTAILAATGGRYATLQSDGTNWIILEGN